MLPKQTIPTKSFYLGRWLSALGLLFIFCAIIFIVSSQRQFTAALTISFNDEQVHHVFLVQNLIREHIEDANRDLLHMSNMLTQTTKTEWDTPLLDRFISSHEGEFSSMSVVDSDGDILLASELFPTNINLFDFVDVEERHPIDETHESYISERIISKNNESATFLLVPFSPSVDHSTHFYVIAELPLKAFFKKQMNYIKGEEIYFILADYSGDIYSIVNVAHDNLPQMERGNLFSLSHDCLDCHLPNSFSDLKTVTETEQVLHSLYTTPDGETYNRTGGLVKILNEKWLISITQPYTKIQGQISQNFQNNAIAVVILIIFSGLGVFFYYRNRRRQSLEIHYHALVNSLNVGIIRTKESGEILSMNQAMLSLVGFQQKDMVIDLSITDIFLHETDWAEIVSLLSKVESTAEVDFWLKSQGGHDFLASLSMRATKNASGEIVYIDGVIQDITDKKQAEEERVRLSRLESIGVLAGGIAHDFNNLLTAVVGNISLSRLAKETSKRNELLVKAEEASFRAQSLTQQLLTFSRGGSPVQIPQSVKQVIQESADFVLRGSNCIIEYHLAPDLKHVNIDADQIKQVVQNLVINANQAMPEGGKITINAVNETVIDPQILTPGEYVKITLQDNGGGIRSEIVDRIFDPYFTTKETGTGLGLAVSYSVIKKHGGIISVHSTQDKGTTFTFYLPTAGSRKTSLHDREEEKIIHGTGNVLIIDDDPDVGETLASYLEELGYKPYFVTVGEEAIQLLKGKEPPFDAVITDLTIPGSMGGVEIKNHIRQIDPSMKIIVMSGYANDPVMAKYSEYGFDGIIKKPFRINTVAEILHKVI